MALAETAKLVTELRLDDKMSGGLRKAQGSLSRFDGAAKRTRSGLATLGKVMVGAAIGVAAGVGLALKAGIDALGRLESVEAQTAAALKSTGRAAHVTAKQVRTLSEAMEDLTTIDDKEIQSAANLMLTFTKVRNEAGKGNDIFNQSVKVMADMSTALGTDMTKGAIQLGKALNDPIAGLTALKKVGVTFDATQVKRIKQFIKEGKIVKAQKIILAELNKEFGGSAAKQADTYQGKMRRLNDALEALQMTLATALMPVLGDVSKELNTFLRQESVVAGVKELGKGLAEAAKGAIAFAKGIPWGAVASGLKTAADWAGKLVGVFTSLPPEMQATIIALAGLNKLSGGAVGGIIGELGKGLIKGVLGINAGVVNLKAATVIGGGGAAGGAAGGAVAGGGKLGKIGAIASTVGKVFVVGMAAAAAVTLAEELGNQSTAIREQATGVQAAAGKMTDGKAIVAAIKTIDDQMADPFNNLALTITGPLNGAKGILEQTRADLSTKLSTLNLTMEGNRSGIGSLITATSATTKEVARTTSGVGSLVSAIPAAGAKTTAAINRNTGGIGRLVTGTNASKAAIVGKVGAVVTATNASRAAVYSRIGDSVAAANRTTSTIARKNWSPTINNRVTIPITVRAVVGATKLAGAYSTNVVTP